MLISSFNIFRYNLCCKIRVRLVILDVSRGLKRRPPSLAPFSPSELESNNKNSFLVSLSQLEKKIKNLVTKKFQRQIEKNSYLSMAMDGLKSKRGVW